MGLAILQTRGPEPEQIHACVDKNGKIQLLYDDGKGTKDSLKCDRGEKLLEWNIQGPQEEPGSKGDPGNLGSQGPVAYLSLLMAKINELEARILALEAGPTSPSPMATSTQMTFTTMSLTS